MRGFPHSYEPEKTMMGELWVGVTLSGWSPVVWIPMKGILRAVKPREEGSIPNNIKPDETRTPNFFTFFIIATQFCAQRPCRRKTR